ncbi:aidA [Scenedesmus sp. PABB004]|nr:aidA [Scenedesmus sp. PABB004]
MRAITYAIAGLVGLVLLPWDPSVIPGPLPRDTSPTPADSPAEGSGWSRSVVYFPCSGVRCQAWLYLPAPPPAAKPPIIVAAHGLGAQKDFGLAPYGEVFARAGLAALIFDYRTFGGSEGEPRHWVSPRRHLQDWADAVAFATGPELAGAVDGSKLLLWGSSFGGGHALTTAAALGDAVTAVVAQVPFTDGRAAFARGVSERGPAAIARALLAGLHDYVRSFFAYPPAYFPLTGAVGALAFMGLTPEEHAAYYAKHPSKKQGGWRNMARCRLALEVSRYRPVAAVPRVTARVLYATADGDRLCPAGDVAAALAATPRGELVTVQGNHFDVYSGRQFEELSARQAAFFREAAGLPLLGAAGGGGGDAGGAGEEE